MDVTGIEAVDERLFINSEGSTVALRKKIVTVVRLGISDAVTGHIP